MAVYKSFESKNKFLDSIKPSLKFGRFFAICPLVVEQTDRQYVLSLSRQRHLICVLSCIGSAALIVPSLTQAAFGETEKKTTFFNLLEIAGVITGLFINLSSAIMPLIKSGELTEFYSVLTEVDELLLSLGERINYQNMARRSKRLMCVCIVVCVFEITADNISNLYTDVNVNQSPSTWSFNLFWYWYYSYIAATLTFMTLNAVHLRERMRKLNFSLAKVVGYRNLTIYTNELAPISLFRVEPEFSATRSVQPINRKGPTTSMSEYIFRIRNIHYKLHAANKSLGSYFEIQMVFIMVYLLISTIALFYYAVFISCIPSSELTWSLSLQAFDWLIVNLLLVGLIAQYKHVFSEEVKGTSRLSHELLSSADGCFLQAKMLTLQIRQCDFSLSPMRLFPLNRTIFVSIVSRITGYTVIVIQFGLKELEKEKQRTRNVTDSEPIG